MSLSLLRDPNASGALPQPLTWNVPLMPQLLTRSKRGLPTVPGSSPNATEVAVRCAVFGAEVVAARCVSTAPCTQLAPNSTMVPPLSSAALIRPPSAGRALDSRCTQPRHAPAYDANGGRDRSTTLQDAARSSCAAVGQHQRRQCQGQHVQGLACHQRCQVTGLRGPSSHGLPACASATRRQDRLGRWHCP